MNEAEDIFHMGFVTLRDFIRYERDLIIVAGVFLGLSSYFITSYPLDMITKLISGTCLALASILFLQMYRDFNKLTNDEVRKDKDKLTHGVRWFNILIMVMFLGMAAHLLMYYVLGNDMLESLLKLLLGVFVVYVFLAYIVIYLKRRKRRSKQ